MSDWRGTHPVTAQQTLDAMPYVALLHDLGKPEAKVVYSLTEAVDAMRGDLTVAFESICPHLSDCGEDTCAQNPECDFHASNECHVCGFDDGEEDETQ